MSTTEATTPEPFSRIKVRVTGLVFCGTDVALLRRDRADSVHWTTIGGNVQDGEDYREAVLRELEEELGLGPGLASTAPELIWMADARITRPGPTPSPRKFHLIYRLHVTPEVRARLATQEFDELPDGGHEVGTVEWHDWRKVDALPLFPPIGTQIAALASPTAPVHRFELEPITDENYTWI
ncbi:8-oxo-dGTP pyrophosphatase MutT, NUDIX family [Streptomyces sp. TLI_053]|uniref:NUDIX domain-containing protein n=1 Tax=Streptomyces sp. TLI_053 TaxID=1855352 RepID=UPI00087C9CDF|nr:NUDIX domain-containing protein [Streptomyces sp. TLI_053]SDS49099.1 8-oxo-dGTP pyrophosphatase MutT, NUDIX family [Streptomyces sp. TLI_053]